MAYFADDNTKTINLVSDSNYWVKISTELHWKDAKQFASVEKDELVYALDKLLQSLIIEWNLDDGENNILPITPENIDRLKRVDAEALVAAIGAVVQSETPTQKKSS